MKGTREKGITLIALVITIIVLLILAGVSINMVIGNNGILSKATDAVKANRLATLAEQIEIWNADREMEKYSSSSTSKSLEEFTTDLVAQGLISEEEKNTILATGKITIDNTELVLEKYTYISSKEELKAFRDNVDNGYSYINETIVLTDNIDLSGENWNPIGSNQENVKFEGTFDGNNKEITNLYSKMDGTFEFIAFFSSINNATIKNLTVDGELVATLYESDEKNPTAAGIVGVTYGNCEIVNCINKASVEKQSANRETGGVVGCVSVDSNLIVTNCANLGTISGGNAAGGVVGTVYGSLIMNDSHNEGDIGIVYAKYVGGLVGRSVDKARFVKVNNSYNKGNLKSVRFAGGVIGYVISEVINIDNTYNEGSIELTNRIAVSYAGGIVGRVVYPTIELTISNSYNLTNIKTSKESKNIVLGGILGETNAKVANIINCYNLGDVEGDYTSGISGLVSGSAATILDPTLNIINSYNKGSVVGRITGAAITRLHNTSGGAVNAQNVYYLDTTASVGVDNYETDGVSELTEEYMKSQEFVNDLNNNQSSIETDIKLNTWKYVENNYPTF